MAALTMSHDSFNPYNLRDGEMSSGVCIYSFLFYILFYIYLFIFIFYV